MLLDAQVALTPGGKPLPPKTPEFEMPVAPVVEWVILVRAVLMQEVGVEEAAPAVFSRLTVIVPVALTLPHPPDNGIL